MERLIRVALPSLLLLGLYYAFFGGRFSVMELRAAEQQLIQLEGDLVRLNHENGELRTWADALEHDPAVLERVAREEYRMVKPGEKLYLVPEEEPADEAGDATFAAGPSGSDASRRGG